MEREVPADIAAFQLNYPGVRTNPSLSANLHFYENRCTSRPQGAFVDDIVNLWRGQYELLEAHHGYIQWLFPIRDASAFNDSSQPLQVHEAVAIRSSKVLLQRFVLAVDLMLDFYGFQLLRGGPGVPPPLLYGVTVMADRKQRMRRFRNFELNTHNDRRVTRMLKSMTEMGLEQAQLMWLRSLAWEIFVTKRLASKRTAFVTYWAETLRSDKARAALRRFWHGLETASSRDGAVDAFRPAEELAVDAGLVTRDAVEAERRKAATIMIRSTASSPAAEALATTPAKRTTSASESPQAKVLRPSKAPATKELVNVTLKVWKDASIQQIERAKQLQTLTGCRVDDSAAGINETIQNFTGRPATSPHNLGRPTVLVLLMPLKESRKVKASELATICTKASVDFNRIHVYVVASEWVDKAFVAHEAADALMRDHLVHRHPRLGGEHGFWL
jgi:hypothetical protein